jgi:MFS family permease
MNAELVIRDATTERKGPADLPADRNLGPDSSGHFALHPGHWARRRMGRRLPDGDRTRASRPTWPVRLGAPLGLVTSSGAFALVTMMPEADFKAWGWRVPFLLSILLLGVGWFVRARVPETPIFEAIKRRSAISKNPFMETILKNPRSFLVAVGLKLSEVSWFYILTIYIVVYATNNSICRERWC